MVTGITHRRRRLLPAQSRPVMLPHHLIDIAEEGQNRTLAISVAGLPEERQRLLAAADGLLKPPQLPIGDAEVGQGLGWRL